MFESSLRLATGTIFGKLWHGVVLRDQAVESSIWELNLVKRLHLLGGQDGLCAPLRSWYGSIKLND